METPQKKLSILKHQGSDSFIVPKKENIG